MGRRKGRRKGSYQDLGDIQEDNAMRMASDNITREDVINALGETALAELRGEVALDAAVQDAMEYLPTRRAQLAAIGATENQLLNLGRLNNDVPMPLIQRHGTSETRTHVDYDLNPITEQMEVVPVMNPDSPQQVLKTVYGPAGREGEGHQSEPAMANALRLMGYQVEYNDPLITNPRTGRTYTKGQSDLKGEKDNRTLRADVMVDRVYEPTAPIPLYTSLHSTQGYDSDTVKRQIQQQINHQGTADLAGAVEALVQRGMLGPDTNHRFGKLARAKKEVMGDEAYDVLLMPGYNEATMARRGLGSPQKTPTAPDNINVVNLVETLAALEAGKAASVKMNKNYGANRTGRERIQVKPEFSRTQDNGIYDLVAAEPLLAQLLSRRGMNAL